jgi:hypothetical protein
VVPSWDECYRRPLPAWYNEAVTRELAQLPRFGRRRAPAGNQVQLPRLVSYVSTGGVNVTIHDPGCA